MRVSQHYARGSRSAFIEQYAKMSRLGLGGLKNCIGVDLVDVKKDDNTFYEQKNVRQQGWPHKDGHTWVAEQINGFL